MNTLSKIIYNLSTVIPLLGTLAVAWYVDKNDCIVPLALIGVGVFLFILLLFVFIYGKRHLPTTPIRVNEISPNDGWLIGYIISYMMPFGNIAFDEFNIIICAVIAVILLCLFPFISNTPPNPLLFMGGYHFYEISAENGISGYLLLSKRKLRRKQDVKVVGRMFEFLLLDKEE